MDYLGLLKLQPQDKMALITDSRAYTYGQLVAEAEALRSTITGRDRVLFIHEQLISKQLVYFIAYSGSKTVPIIATEASKGQSFSIEQVPAAACMGVMTSGSTGQSKLLWRSYKSWADFFPEQNRIFGIDKKAVVFCQGSLAFTGNLSIYMGVFAAGGTIVATEKFRPKHWQQLIKDHKVNGIYLIPSKLLLLAKFYQGPCEAIKFIISGSQSMGRQEADKLALAFPQADLTLYYGASELNYISYIKGESMTNDRTDIGLPFKGVQVAIANEELYITTPYHIEGITMPFSLKDRGSISQDGHLHFLGRTDDICSVNGRKISSLKVEQALGELPGVKEAAVLSIHKEDADYLVAYIAADKAYTKQELVQLLRQGFLEAYEIPHQFVFLTRLPRNESGKIDKLSLKGHK